MVKISAARPAVFSRMALFAMLCITMAAATLHLSGSTAQAAQADLSWTAPTTNTDGTPITNLAGYNLYIGSASKSYDQKINVGNQTSYLAGNLSDGSTYYFAVTAYDSSGLESAHSTEVSKSYAALPVSHLITATAGAGGTITATNNTKVNVATGGTTTISTVTVADGANQAFAIAPAAGYAISDVSVDGTSVGPVASYSFSAVKGAHSISASFAATASYAITSSAAAGGTITPAGTARFAAGANQSYTITPVTGYRIAAVIVDGASVGAVTSYTFSNIRANHTISASFALATPTTSYTIAASTTVGGTISPAGSKSVAAGGSVSYTITPATGFRIAYLLVDGVPVATASRYTFSNVQANHTIKAGFYAFAVNSGGAQYIGGAGVTYLADGKFTGGTPYSVSTTVPGTNDSKLYQSWRYGNFYYSVPVPNGNYDVRLKFAENLKKAAGQRVFNVQMQGKTVLSNLDVYARAKNNAYDVIIPVSVTNGVITVKFVNVTGAAMVSGMLITAK